jgi:hypothetical protein
MKTSMKPAKKTALQRAIEWVDKFWQFTNIAITSIFRFFLAGLRVTVNAIANLLGGFLAQLGQQETATAIYFLCFVAAIGFAIHQFGFVVGTVFQVLNRLPSPPSQVYWIGLGVGAFLNYAQLHSRLWRFKDTVAAYYKGVELDGEDEPVTPEMVVNNRFGLAFRRREKTTRLFYRIETLTYIVYVGCLLFGFAGSMGTIALGFVQSLVALKLPEMLLGLAEDSLALMIGQKSTNAYTVPEPEDLGEDKVPVQF